MKSFKLLAVLFIALILGACEEDAKKPVVEDDPIAPAITTPADATTIVITEESLTTEVSVAWSVADFGLDVAVTYALQLDLENNLFATPVTLSTGNAATATFTHEALNNAIITTLLQSGDEEVTVELRVVAKSPGLDDLPSEIITFDVTPYKPEVIGDPVYPMIYIAGSFQGWDITNATPLASISDNGVYEGYFYIPAGGDNQFKLYSQKAWDEESWGKTADVDGKIEVANCACNNFVAPADGYYWLEVNVTDLTYKLVPMSWGVIGDATATNWDSDTDMTYNADLKVLQVTMDLKGTGSWKFRANDAWAHAMGLLDGKLVYSDHLTNGNTPGTANIDGQTAGNYTITLNLSSPWNYKYSIVKN